MPWLRLMDGSVGTLYFRKIVMNKIYAVSFYRSHVYFLLKEQCLITVPKLEFQAAILTVELKCTILEEIDFNIHKNRFHCIS